LVGECREVEGEEVLVEEGVDGVYVDVVEEGGLGLTGEFGAAVVEDEEGDLEGCGWVG
jgi:hypothetical protein